MGVIGIAADGQVVVHRPGHSSPQCEEQGAGREFTARTAHLWVLKRERCAAVSFAVAAEQLPLLAADHQPIRRQHACVADKEAVQIVDTHLARQSARQSDVTAVQHHGGMWNLNGHGATYRAPITMPHTACINTFVRGEARVRRLHPHEAGSHSTAPTIPPASSTARISPHRNPASTWLMWTFGSTTIAHNSTSKNAVQQV
jgi:hypothetical protein